MLPAPSVVPGVIRTQSTHLLLYSHSLRNAPAWYCHLTVSSPGITVSHRYFLSLHLFLCHQLFCESDWRVASGKKSDTWDRYILVGARSLELGCTLQVWTQFTVCCRSRGQSRAQEGPASVSCVMMMQTVSWVTITPDTIFFSVSESWNKDN